MPVTPPQTDNPLNPNDDTRREPVLAGEPQTSTPAVAEQENPGMGLAERLGRVESRLENVLVLFGGHNLDNAYARLKDLLSPMLVTEIGQAVERIAKIEADVADLVTATKTAAAGSNLNGRVAALEVLLHDSGGLVETLGKVKGDLSGLVERLTQRGNVL